MSNWHRRHAIAFKLTAPLVHIPVVGLYVRSFWYSIIADGLVGTLKPRWGAITFGYLNDGIKPTWYHAWRSVRDPNTAIYIHGAPKNRSEL